MLSVDELELLSRLRSGDLSPDEAIATRALISTRPELQQAHARLERLDLLAREGVTHEAPPALDAHDQAIVDAVLKHAARTGLLGVGGWKLPAAAAAIAVIAFAVWATKQPPREPELERERVADAAPAPLPAREAAAIEEDLPAYPEGVPGIIVGPLPEALALWTPETKLHRSQPDTIALASGTLVVTGRGRVLTGDTLVEIDGEALVSTEPAVALAHVIRSLRSHPQQEGVDMRNRFEGFKGRMLAPAGAALLVLVTQGEVIATAPDGTKSPVLRKGQAWSPPASQGTNRVALEGSGAPQKPGPEAGIGPAVVASGEVDLAAVHAAVLASSPQLAECFVEGQKQDPTLQGALTLVLTIAPNPAPAAASSGGNATGTLREATIAEDYSLQNPWVASCMLRVLSQTTWPKPAGESAQVRYPLQLMPRGTTATPGAGLLLPQGATPDAQDARRVMVNPDRQARLTVEGRGHTLGPDSAPVKVVVFSDFECSFCLKGFRTLLELRGRYGDRIQLQYRHKPLPTHPNARLTAAAAIAADRQGRFWEFATRLADAPGQRMKDGLEAHAAALGLDLLRFKSDMEAAETRARVDADVAEGDRLGARGIPTTFINGREVVGARTPETYARIIDEELARAAGR